MTPIDGSLVACDRCGAYAVRHWSTKLRSCCTGRGASQRLANGLHTQPACAAATMPGERAYAKDIAWWWQRRLLAELGG
eukprot:3526025-Amphidinium_carterae.1